MDDAELEEVELDEVEEDKNRMSDNMRICNGVYVVHKTSPILTLTRKTSVPYLEHFEVFAISRHLNDEAGRGLGKSETRLKHGLFKELLDGRYQ